MLKCRSHLESVWGFTPSVGSNPTATANYQRSSHAVLHLDACPGLL